MKNIYAILHGITDKKLLDLDGMSPLQKAKKDNLDFIAREGSVRAIGAFADKEIENSLASLILKEDVNYFNKSLLYKAALNINSNKKFCLTFRLVSVGENNIIDVYDELVSDSEGKALVNFLNKKLSDKEMEFFHVGGAEILLLTDDDSLYSEDLYCERNPLRSVGKDWLELNPALKDFMLQVRAILQESSINEIREEFEENYINGLLLVSASESKILLKKYSCDNSFVFTSSLATVGLARILGVDYYYVEPETVKYQNLQIFFNQINTVLQFKDNIYCEFFYLWDSTYNGDLRGKVKGIEYLDQMFIKPLLNKVSSKGVFLTVLPLQNSDIKMCDWYPGVVPVLSYPAKGESLSNIYQEFDFCAEQELLQLNYL